LDQNSRAGSEEKTISELEKDLLLAFEEQEKEHNQSGTGYGRLEELERGTPLRSEDQGEEPQEQQQRQEVVREAIREEDDDDNAEQELQGKKLERQDGNAEVAIAVTTHAMQTTRTNDFQSGGSFLPHLPTTL
jgi:hypothetical protein